MSLTTEFDEAQLEAARATAWRQTGDPVLTLRADLSAFEGQRLSASTLSGVGALVEALLIQEHVGSSP